MKDELKQTAIHNLIKKCQFKDLLLELERKLITENEFEKEVESLVIQAKWIGRNDFLTLIELVKELNISHLYVDEIADIFGVSVQCLMQLEYNNQNEQV